MNGNIKKTVTFLLLLFVAGSLVFVIIKDRLKQPTNPLSSPQAAAKASPGALPEITGRVPDRVEVIYFHGNRRCKTCKTIEKYTRETVEQKLASLVKEGKVSFRQVNFDRPENYKFKERYKLSFQTVVISGTIEGREVTWHKLDQVWQLVKNKNSFEDFVSEQVRKMLEGNDK